MAVTLPAGLPRVVPPSGAVISGVEIPGGVRVSCPSVFGFYLMPSADSREPECPFRFVFRRYFCARARVSSRSVASAGIQSIRELAGCIFERAAQLPGHKVSDKVFRSLVMGLIRYAAWHIANYISPLRTYSDDSTFVWIQASENPRTIVMSDD
jgi:hypothetical protein